MTASLLTFAYSVARKLSLGEKDNPINIIYEARPYIIIELPCIIICFKGKVPRSRDGWIIGNVDYGGFYRVNYDLDMWNRLSEQLNSDHKIFSGANRAGLIGDAFNLARYVHNIPGT